jgi:hypothetical protein
MLLHFQAELTAQKTSLELETSKLAALLRSVFPSHVLSMCFEFALKERRDVERSGFKSAGTLLGRHLSDVPIVLHNATFRKFSFSKVMKNMFPFFELFMHLQRAAQKQRAITTLAQSSAPNMVALDMPSEHDADVAVIDSDLFLQVTG